MSYRYRFEDNFYEIMARVACDEELLNRELDALQDANLPNESALTLKGTALCAVEGVRNSLTNLKREVDCWLEKGPLSAFKR